MKQLVKGALNAVGLPHLGWHLKRRGLDKRLIDSYLAQPGPHKLHIGCGFNVLPGWLNSDYYPGDPEVVHLNATEPFPFDDASFDFVFSEHMIEHIPYPMGCRMLQECLRGLKPGGVARISTPNLNFLIELYGSKTELQREYIQWSQKCFIPWAADANDTFVINNFVRDWGHCFIYDDKTLRQAMTNAGFIAVERCELQQSRKAELRELENEKRSPPGFLRLETITIEGERPS
jgi:predicted SAM-dependent methyltransferase